MKNLIPSKVEVAILLTLAVCCTVIVKVFPVFDLGMAAMAVPLFLCSGLLGLRRNAKLAAIRATVGEAEAVEIAE